MLLRDFIYSSRRSLGKLYSEEEARSLVTALCSSIAGVTSVTHIIEPEYAITPGTQERLDAAMGRLLKGEPLQYVLSEAWFCGRRFRVNSSVLIPRPETEEMTAIAVSRAREMVSLRENASGFRAIDLCTGSGCIAWTIAMELPQAEVLAVDISEAALSVAASQGFGQSGNPRFIKADVLDYKELDKLGSFEMIISNPPYVREAEKTLMKAGVLDWEPSLALFVPDSDPLVFYRAEAAFAATALRPGGFGIFEINEGLGKASAALFEDAGFRDVRILKDFRGRDRFAFFVKNV